MVGHRERAGVLGTVVEVGRRPVVLEADGQAARFGEGRFLERVVGLVDALRDELFPPEKPHLAPEEPAHRRRLVGGVLETEGEVVHDELAENPGRPRLGFRAQRHEDVRVRVLVEVVVDEQGADVLQVGRDAVDYVQLAEAHAEETVLEADAVGEDGLLHGVFGGAGAFEDSVIVPAVGRGAVHGNGDEVGPPGAVARLGLVLRPQVVEVGRRVGEGDVVGARPPFELSAAEGDEGTVIRPGSVADGRVVEVHHGVHAVLDEREVRMGGRRDIGPEIVAHVEAHGDVDLLGGKLPAEIRQRGHVVIVAVESRGRSGRRGGQPGIVLRVGPNHSEEERACPKGRRGGDAQGHCRDEEDAFHCNLPTESRAAGRRLCL